MKYRISIVADNSTPMELIGTVLKKYGCKIEGFEPFDDEEEQDTAQVVHLQPRKEPKPVNSPQVAAKKAKALLTGPLPGREEGPTKRLVAILSRLPMGTPFDLAATYAQMAEAGWDKQCVRNTARNIQDRKLLEKAGYGMFKRVGDWTNITIYPPKVTRTAQGKSTSQVIWDWLRTLPDQSEVAVKELNDLLTRNGFNSNSWGSALHKIMKDNPGKLEKIGMSLYKVNHIKPVEPMPPAQDAPQNDMEAGDGR